MKKHNHKIEEDEMNIHHNHTPYFVAAIYNQWPACNAGKSCIHSVARWKIAIAKDYENGSAARYIYVYTNDMTELDTISAKHKAMFVFLSGYWHKCTNTIEESDLCDYSDPKQYMPWRSHNQPHS